VWQGADWPRETASRQRKLRRRQAALGCASQTWSGLDGRTHLAVQKSRHMSAVVQQRIVQDGEEDRRIAFAKPAHVKHATAIALTRDGGIVS